MKKYKFYKIEDDDWFIDLPEWEGDRWDLLMVEGADTMLDILADGEKEVSLILSVEAFEGSDVLIKGDDSRGGAHYHVEKLRGIEYNKEIWLCGVTLFVFGYLPEKIHVSKL